jgi:hypothetical protein
LCPVLLHDEITGEAVGGLDDDDPDAVAGDARQQRGKARPHIDRISAAHRGIVELRFDLVAGAPGESRDGLALTLLAVLIGADVGCRAGTEIRKRRGDLLPAHWAVFPSDIERFR